ncbi:MAG: PAS domain-containing protein [Treponema sp.]|jgi:signal transduction histidine kinase|nr:PAS domain-containing protein [Treponema sp.]
MSGFYRRAISKLNRLNLDQCRELLVSASQEIFRLDTVLDSLPCGILVCDEKHRLLMANKAALRFLPLSYTEGGLLWELIPDENIANFFQQSLKRGDRALEQEMNIHAQGQGQGPGAGPGSGTGPRRLLSISVHPLVEKRKITGSLVYIEDITEKRGREVRLRRAENLASLTTLAAGVAHEIKNPLGAISIHLQLLRKALGKKEKHNDTPSDTDALVDKYFSVLNEEVDRLNGIVIDFLFAVRPMSLELCEANLNALIAELGEFIRAELEQSNIRLLLELDEKLPPVLIDERYMKQVLLNLIKNAQGAMPNGGLLAIATMGSDSEVRISVCDTGAGISQENLKKIFEPYFTTKGSGTGLGLTLVYKIIREHRGEMSVDSREGEGTDFEIILPVYQKKQRLIDYSGAKNEI